MGFQRQAIYNYRIAMYTILLNSYVGIHAYLFGWVPELKTSKESRVIHYDTENLESTTKVNGYIVSVRGQQLVQCRTSVNCTGDDLGAAMDGENCCLDNPRALAYVPNNGSCVPCVGESVLL